jgi:hypothetical protein
VGSERFSAEQRFQVRQLAARFTEAWRGPEPPRLDASLPPAGSPIRLAALHELMPIDLEGRWARGGRPLLEEYLGRYPELGGPASLPAALVHAEYRARHAHGDRPALEAYAARFPAQLPELRRLAGSTTPADVQGTLADDSVPTAAPAAVPSTLPRPPASSASGSQTVSGGYRLVRPIGSGQYGQVFEAEAPGGRVVAVKRSFRAMDDETSRRDLHALELLRALNHPYLLQFHASWVSDGRLHIAMELADDSLADWFKQCRAAKLPGIPHGDLVAYMAEAAEALDYLHSQHVLHRDIKPENLLRIQGHAKVADFGLARLLQDDMGTATFCGTPLYMAPEVWGGKASTNTDQYSLALTYAHMLTGRRVFEGSLPDLMVQHASGEPNLGNVPEAERAVVARALAKKPTDRYPSCRAFVQALQQASRKEVPPPRPPGPSRRVLLGLAAGLLAVAGAGGWVVYHFRPPRPPLPAPPWVPSADFRPAEGAAPVEVNGKPYWDRLLSGKLPGPPMEFLLYRQDRATDPPAFYISRDKVTRAQLRAAMKDGAMPDVIKRFAENFVWFGPGKWELNSTEGDKGRWPATDVTVTEAHCFALWVAGDFGALPSCVQWDKAGGRFDDKVGPYRGDGEEEQSLQKASWRGQIALFLPDPRPVGTSPADESLFGGRTVGCRDMAGNGKEWTRDLRGHQRFVPLAKLTGDMIMDAVVLRGHSFTEKRPFRYDDDYILAGDERALSYKVANSEVGFRIVIHLPVGP